MKNANATYWGQEVSAYGQEHGFVDYSAFARAFNHVNITNKIQEIDPYLLDNVESGQPYEDSDGNRYTEFPEGREDVFVRDIYQFFVIDEFGQRLCEEAGEIVCWSDALDAPVWCVTHFGTPWTGVLTDIPLEPSSKEA
ncbi:MAG: hypothetical protein IKZ87_04955 [Actinomycetaceae bacterium]|nr:hypothetical protein [Actinomycetaceae bacterium]